MKREHSNKHYLPSLLLNLALPVAIPITYGLFVLIFLIDYISKPSEWPLSQLGIIFVLSTVVFFFIWLIVYVIAKYVSFYFVLNNGNLCLKKANIILKEISLDSISYFIIETTATLEASGSLVKIELFVMDHSNSKQKLYENDIGNSLLRNWQKFIIKVKGTTNRNFKFHHYAVDLDGKKYESEEYKKIQWKKRTPFFRSPYK